MSDAWQIPTDRPIPIPFAYFDVLSAYFATLNTILIIHNVDVCLHRVSSLSATSLAF